MCTTYFNYIYSFQKEKLGLAIWCKGGKRIYLLYPPQTKFVGVYRNHPVCLSVRLSTYLVSATPPKPLDGFWWNFTQSMYTIWRCARRILVAIRYHSREIIGLRLFETCCSMGDLVSATPPKPLDGFWWHFTWRLYTIWRCAWRILVAVGYHSREIIRLRLFLSGGILRELAHSISCFFLIPLTTYPG